MKNIRSQKIIQLLININYNFEKKLNDFPLRHDIAELLEFECENYLNIISEQIVPLVVEYLDDYPEENVNIFTKFVNEKYISMFKDDVNNCKKKGKDSILLLNRRMIKDFSTNVLQYLSKSNEEKDNFMREFLSENEKLLLQICRNNTELFLYTVGQLANPRLQYTILNGFNTEINTICQKFISSLSQNFLDVLILKTCCYPLDITMEDYCNKWISKDKIYIKFMKNILQDKYEYSKLLLKIEQNKNRKKQKKLLKDRQ